jgi:hypothetical protein
MDRHHWSRQISRLDPASDHEQIYRILVSHEFPWDMNQSLSFALYRTYAVSPASCGTSAATRKVMTLRGWEPSPQRR